MEMKAKVDWAHEAQVEAERATYYRGQWQVERQRAERLEKALREALGTINAVLDPGRNTP